MKKLACSIVLLGTQALAVNGHASSALDLAVSSDMVAADYMIYDEARASLWEIGATYNEDNDATAASVAYNVVGDVFKTREVRSGLGLKAVVHDTFQTGGSVALGGSIRFTPEDLMGLGLEGQIYYAPEILNFNDADRYHELLARVTYDVNPRATVFAGWLDKTVKYDDAAVSEVEISDGFNVGLRLQF